jgi:nitrous oxide reductase
MDLEQLQLEADKDLKINDTELDLESLKTPQLHNKYMKHYTKFKLLLTRTEDELRLMKKNKWEYYTGKADPSVYQAKPFDLKIMRTDIDKYLEADEDLQKLSQKVAYLITVIDFLDRTLRVIVNRTYTIKNAIEWRRFTSGAV